MPHEVHHRRIALLARLSYAGVICLATLSNLGLQPQLHAVRARLHRAFDPSWFGAHVLFVDGVRNVLLFAGLGAVWMVTARAGRTRQATVEATLWGALLSLAVEAVQLWSPIRFASVFDFVTNAGGAALGALGVALCVALGRRALSRPGLLGVPAWIFALTYLAALLCATLAPFYGAASPGPRIPLLDAALAVPGGAFLAIALLEAGLPPLGATALAAVLGPALAVSFQLARMAHGGPVGAGLGTAQGIGLALGSLAALLAPAVARRARDPRRARLALALYAGALVLWSWRPFVPRTRLADVLAEFTAPHLVPMRSIGTQFELLAAFDVAGQFLLFLPLGVLLAVWPLRARGALRHVLPALYLAVALELGQAFLEGRFLDVTDALVRCAGAAVGFIVAQRAGAAPHGEALGAARPRDRRVGAGRIVRRAGS